MFSKSFYGTGITLVFKSDLEYNTKVIGHVHSFVDRKLLNNIKQYTAIYKKSIYYDQVRFIQGIQVLCNSRLSDV